MVKRVNVSFNDDEFEELKKKKDKLGLSWYQVIKEGLKCLELQRQQNSK